MTFVKIFLCEIFIHAVYIEFAWKYHKHFGVAHTNSSLCKNSFISRTLLEFYLQNINATVEGTTRWRAYRNKIFAFTSIYERLQIEMHTQFHTVFYFLPPEKKNENKIGMFEMPEEAPMNCFEVLANRLKFIYSILPCTIFKVTFSMYSNIVWRCESHTRF